MTYEQIEKEFGLYLYKGTLGPDVWSKEFVMLPEYKQVELIKSFYKQSFIKYLQSQIERHKARIEDLKERQPHHTNDVVDYMQGSIDTLMDEINNLQAQIKELQ